MSDFNDTTPRFQWRHRQDDGWGWTRSHALSGPCSGCIPAEFPRACPRCAGRVHREVAIVDDHLGESLFCQEERTDDKGRPTRMRSAPSSAEVAAKVAAMRRHNREVMDRWIGRTMGGVLALQVVGGLVFIALVLWGVLD